MPLQRRLPGLKLCETAAVLGLALAIALSCVSSGCIAITKAVATSSTVLTVAITSPAAGATLSGTIAVSASASDNVAVASVQFQLDGANLGSLDTAAPYSVSLDTSKVANGSHTLTAVAKDAAGNQASSAPVSITVNNVVSGTGPLRVSTINPRYFTDNRGKAILIAADHTWETLQNQGTAYPFGVTNTFDYSAYLDFLTTRGFNATVLWTWWLPNANPNTEGPINVTAAPFPWVRTSTAGADDGSPIGTCNSTTGQGCKFDFNTFNQTYFDTLRTRAVQAANAGIYVEVMLFNGYEFQFDTQSNDGNAFASSNNINGINCPGLCPTQDAPSGTAMPAAVWAIEKAYIHKVIDTVNDLDNVLYYVSNESPSPASDSWETKVIAEVKNYEASKPKRHPVGMVFQYKGGTDQKLYNSAADWVSPAFGGGGLNVPPDATGQCPVVTGNGGVANTSSPNCKVVINDTDHDCGICASQAWPWQNFTHGNSVQFMDGYLVDPNTGFGSGSGATGCSNGMCVTVGTVTNNIRNAEADVLAYANKIDLINMVPSDFLSTSGFVLANPGSQYLVYSTSNSFTLTTVPGTYTAEWFNPTTHTIASTESLTVGSSHAFTAPFSGQSVLWLHK